MTGTASELYDYNENNTIYNFDLLSAWLHGRVKTNCALVNLSRSGCSILTPKTIEPPKNSVKIVVMAPDDDNRVHTIITAEVRWTDSQYSKSYHSSGFAFSDIDASTNAEIDSLLSLYQKMDHKTLKCNILNL